MNNDKHHRRAKEEPGHDVEYFDPSTRPEPHLMARKGRPIRSALAEFGFEQRFERH